MKLFHFLLAPSLIFAVPLTQALDSDNDGISDAIEILHQYDHLSATSTPTMTLLPAYSVYGGHDSKYAKTFESIGDINNDNKTDFIVSRQVGYAPEGHTAGAVEILSGADGSTLYEYFGAEGSVLFGWHASAAGDLNADSYPDFLISERTEINGYSTGSVYAYSGQTGALLYQFDGEHSSEDFGAHTAAAGDVNKDGFDDIIVGAINHRVEGSPVGALKVYSGKDGSLLYKKTGSQFLSYYGNVVAGMGDINNDGYDDFAASASTHKIDNIKVGLIEVFSGKTGDLLHRFQGNETHLRLGEKFANAGDLNNDGYPDILASTYISDPSQDGPVVIFSGFDGSQLTVKTEATLPVDKVDFGKALSTAGDVNNDGYDDYLISAPKHLNRGVTFVYSGKDHSKLFELKYGKTSAEFGSSVTSADDINQDGYADIAVAALKDGFTNTTKGSITLFISSVDLDGDGKADNVDTDDDGDGLSDETEQTLGTNSKLKDSDLDGVNDKIEVDAGSDPTDANSFPLLTLISFENGIKPKFLYGDASVDSSHAQHGSHSLRTDTISNNRFATLTMRVEMIKNSFRFWAKTSTEEGEDKLIVRIDSDVVIEISGETEWTQYRIRHSEGFHSIDFIYSKNRIGSSGDDAIWLDAISYRQPISAGDSDADTLSDFDETNIHFTNPQVVDTDSDGINDQTEVANGSNPIIDPANPQGLDSDNDGLTDSDELILHKTNYLVADTDGDGMNDGDEVSALRDPRIADSAEQPTPPEEPVSPEQPEAPSEPSTPNNGDTSGSTSASGGSLYWFGLLLFFFARITKQYRPRL